MNEKSLPKFAASPDRLDRATVEVVRVVNAIAARLGIEYFLCGATALDVMLTGVFGSQPGRATIDVDFAFTVESWDEFDRLKAALVATGEFEASEKIEQRLYSLRHDRRIVDLIPFGGVENPKGTVSWPPNNDASLNVAGFEEALSSAVRVSLADDFSAPVASLAGLTILKLLAWADRKNINNKDSFDILHILGQYAEAGNEERLYTDEAAILELSDFDLELAGARLLGADCRRLTTPETARRIHHILASDSDMEVLTIRGFTSRKENQFIALLLSFRKGFLEEQ